MKFRIPLLRFVAAVFLSSALLAPTGCTAKYRKARGYTRADRYFKAGDYENAKIEYLNVLHIDPQSVAAIERLGIIWFDQGAPLRAFPYLLGARELAPADADARIKLGLAYMTVGQPAEARKEALEILKRDPAQGQAALLLADTTTNRDELAENEQVISRLPGPDDAFRLQAKASLAMRTNSVATARRYLERALAADPKSSTVHLALATVALIGKDKDTAAREYKTAAELAPSRGVALIKYADFSATNGAPDQAKAVLAEATRRTPDFIPAWQMQARIAVSEKTPDAALALLEHIFSVDADNIEARLLQADALLAKSEVKKAVAALERLDGIYKSVPLIKFQLARAYLQDNNRSQAIIALTQAVNASPDYLEANLLLANLNLEAGDAERAVTAMTDLLQRHPKLQAAQLTLAEADRVLGRLDAAAAVLDGILKAGAQDTQPFLLMGMVQRQMNHDAAARQCFEKALESSPDDLTLLSQLTELDLKEKKGVEALQRAQARLAKTPQSAPALFLLARVYSGLKDWEHAEATLLKALELDPDYTQAYDLLVSNDVANGRLPEALNQLKARLAKNPHDTRALMAAALIYDRQQDAPQARDAYEKLLAISPNAVSILNNLSYLYAEKLNQPDRAYDLARRAHTLAPNDSPTNDTLGWILYKRGDYQQALTLLQASTSKLSDDPETQFHLAMANYMMGEAEPARAGLQRAAASPKDFPGKNEIPGRLALLGNGSRDGPALSRDELERLSKTQANDPLVWDRLGNAYENQQAWREAGAAYEQALKLNPKLVAALVRLAWLDSGPLHDLDKADKLAKSARDLAPNDPAAAAVLGHTSYLTGNYPRAYSLLQAGLVAAPNDARLLHDLAWTTYFLGNVPESLPIMQSALQADPEKRHTADGADFLAMAALDSPGAQNLAASAPGIERLLKADPNNVPASMAQAALQTQRGDASAALATYQDILHRLPDFAPAQKRLAALYMQQPNGSEKAYDLVSRARKTLPKDMELAGMLGQLCYARKEYPYAIQLLQQSASGKPLDANSLYCLGMSYVGTGENPRGKEALQQALSAGLQGPSLETAKKTLTTL